VNRIAAGLEELPRMSYRARKRRIENLRLAVQVVSVLLVVWIGVEFTVWVFGLQAGQVVGDRPPGVEGFLPISALITLRHWLLTGVLSHVHPAGLVILLLAVATGLLLKKAFCSWLCPVGALSEGLAAASRRVFGGKVKAPRWLDYPLRGVKYLLLAFFLWAVFVQMSPGTIEKFLHSPYNKVADVKMLLFFVDISALALGVLIALVVASFLIPYFWCRYLCPYGALLGVLSVASPLKVTRNPEVCNACGHCEKACPAHIRVDQVLRVRSDECTACLKCVAACPHERALEVATPGPWRRALRPAVFAVLVVTLFFGGIGLAKLAGYWRSEITTTEYMRRVQEIDHPKYHHARGQVPDYGPED